MKLSPIVAFFLFVALNKAQNSCDWYNWTSSDWPTNTTSQNFEQVIGSDAYLGDSDFESGGQFYGQTWSTVFFTNPYYYRPLGFKYAILGAYNDPTVCIKADDTTGYLVELMVYSFRAIKICVADMSADNYNLQDTGLLTACATQYLYKCFTADTSASNLKVSLYCSTGCEDNQEQQLLFRFRRSDLTWTSDRTYASDNPEMWCAHIASSIEWPDELSDSVPSEYTAANSNLSSGNTFAISLSCILITLLSIISLL